MAVSARPLSLPPELAAVRDAAPETYAAIAAAQRATYAALDPALLELVALQIAHMIHRGDPASLRAPEHADPAKAAALERWAQDPRFTDAERACLALAEQFVVSVADVDDALVDAVLAHLDPGDLFALVNAMYLFDATERLAAVTQRIFVTEEQA
jgi:alkylhydroperoxidase family enzyme